VAGHRLHIEFLPKHTERLDDIVSAYATSDYAVVQFVVRHPRLARRLNELIASRCEGLPGLRYSGPTIQIHPWMRLDDHAKQAIAG
jgi:hypothetical protein